MSRYKSPYRTYAQGVRKRATVYSDGGCAPTNPGPGAWAYIVRFEGPGGLFDAQQVGFQEQTTNNRMELTAAFQGIRAARDGGATIIHLVSDSRYLVNGLTKWLEGWKEGGWIKPKENQEYWKSLYEIIQGIKLTAEWVRGHNGHPENEEVDRMVKDTITAGRGR